MAGPRESEAGDVVVWGLIFIASGSLLAGCAHRSVSVEATGDLPVLPMTTFTEDEARRLAESNLIEDADAHWQLESWSRAELDGSPPAELVIRVIIAGGEGTYEQHTAAYSVAADGSTRPLAPTLETGGYRDPGYLEVVDLDGDGRDELMIVGDNSADSSSTLSLFVYQADAAFDQRLEDINHEEAPGVSYLPWDVTGDGQLEILALDRDWSSSEQPPSVRTLALRDGRYRFVEREQPVESYLGALTAHVTTETDVRRPWILLPLILDLLRLHDVRPGDCAEVANHILEHRLDNDASIAAEPWLRMVALLAPEAFLALARASLVEECELLRHLGRGCYDLAVHGTPEQREVLLELLDSALAAERGIDLIGSIQAGVATRQDQRAAQRLRSAMADEGRSTAWRAELLSRFGAQDPSCADLVLSILAGEADRNLTRAAALVLASSSGFSRPRIEEWRAALPVARLRPLLDHEDEQVRRRVLSHLVDRDEPQIVEIFLNVLSNSNDWEERRIAFRGLRRFSECSHRSLYLRELRRSTDSNERRELHQRLVCSSPEAELVIGLDEVRSRRELTPYLSRLSRERDTLAARAARAILARLVQMLTEVEDVWMRADIVVALADLDLPESRAETRRRFSDDRDFRIRAAAAKALGIARDERGERLLVEWVANHAASGDSEVEWVRGAVVEALASYRTASALVSLTNELEIAADRGRRYGVLHALSLRADEGAAAALRRYFGTLVERDSPDCNALGQTLRFRFALRYEGEGNSALDPLLLRDARVAFGHCPVDGSLSFFETMELWSRHRDEAVIPLLQELRASHSARDVRGRAAIVLRTLAEQRTD